MSTITMRAHWAVGMCCTFYRKWQVVPGPRSTMVEIGYRRLVFVSSVPRRVFRFRMIPLRHAIIGHFLFLWSCSGLRSLVADRCMYTDANGSKKIFWSQFERKRFHNVQEGWNLEKTSDEIRMVLQFHSRPFFRFGLEITRRGYSCFDFFDCENDCRSLGVRHHHRTRTFNFFGRELRYLLPTSISFSLVF
jgi:hypothetical protein